MKNFTLEQRLFLEANKDRIIFLVKQKLDTINTKTSEIIQIHKNYVTVTGMDFYPYTIGKRLHFIGVSNVYCSMIFPDLESKNAIYYIDSRDNNRAYWFRNRFLVGTKFSSPVAATAGHFVTCGKGSLLSARELERLLFDSCLVMIQESISKKLQPFPVYVDAIWPCSSVTADIPIKNNEVAHGVLHSIINASQKDFDLVPLKHTRRLLNAKILREDPSFEGEICKEGYYIYWGTEAQPTANNEKIGIRFKLKGSILDFDRIFKI